MGKDFHRDDSQNETSELEESEDIEVLNWDNLTESECERLLEESPFNNFLRLRLSQIWISEDRNILDAHKLLSTIMRSKPKF